ncbi:MAG TPA: PA2779 family protein [Nitrospirota bacterium]|nr:PA2779 family protein [Nitrospirota bacterium]
MKTMLKTFYAKPLAIYLAVALLAISSFAGPAEAMFVPSAPNQNAAAPPAAPADRAAGLAKLQAALESKLVQQKLMDYGLSPEETMTRVNKLSDEQINQLATHTDSLQAGGDPVDLAIGLVILALLVVLLLYLLQGRVVIR